VERSTSQDKKRHQPQQNQLISRNNGGLAAISKTSVNRGDVENILSPHSVEDKDSIQLLETISTSFRASQSSASTNEDPQLMLNLENVLYVEERLSCMSELLKTL
jgi:hypothetical protein